MPRVSSVYIVTPSSANENLDTGEFLNSWKMRFFEQVHLRPATLLLKTKAGLPNLGIRCTVWWYCFRSNKVSVVMYLVMYLGFVTLKTVMIKIMKNGLAISLYHELGGCWRALLVLVWAGNKKSCNFLILSVLCLWL